MAAVFSQSMRALAADRCRWSWPGLILVLALLGGWGTWFLGARVVATSLVVGRLEPGG
jgi:hypothetical protein